jgi:phosphoglycolate phosphatase
MNNSSALSKPSQPIVLLFDIDGTLLTAHGAGKRAMNLALKRVFGFDNAFDGLDFRGMTDALIVELALAKWHDAVHPSQLEAVYSVYLEQLERELRESESAQATPGAGQLLDWVRQQPGPVAIGLGTGNIEPAAYMKLRRVNLGAYFAFGGFGSDHRIRSEIIKIGAERGSALLGCPRDECQIIVIGDTFHDIDAALANGATAIGVGTSGVSPEALLRRGASFAFETLESPLVRTALLGQAPRRP